MDTNSLISVEGLQVHFLTVRGVLKAVNNVSFEVNKGEAYGIVGESGSGKSVTALAILRILSPNARIRSGRILFKGRDLLSLNEKGIRAIRGKEISMVFQDPQSSFDPIFTIANQIGEAVSIHRGLVSKEMDTHITGLLRSVGIPEPEIRKNQYPHQFSGGMKQRAMSAMALSNSPQLIIADEPTTSLDVTIQAQIIELFKNLIGGLGISILLITHDMGLIAELCDRVSVMYAGYILETADVYTLFKNPRHPYTKALIDSIPRLDLERDELESIPGRVPNPLDLPLFCVYQPRCKFATDICLRGIPGLQEVGEGAKVACYRAQRGEL
jgi:peptide/nickel transport system ATP-binding protein